jgi:uncharacterized protein (DUF2267 family)
MMKKQTPKEPQTGDDTVETISRAFSDLELLAAADVIKAAISEGRKHVDQEALKRVYAKLMAAYKWRSQGAVGKQ